MHIDYQVPQGLAGTIELQPMENLSCVAVSITDDMVYEGDEKFTFKLSNPVDVTLGNTSEVTITIMDNGEWKYFLPDYSSNRWGACVLIYFLQLSSCRICCSCVHLNNAWS